MQKAIGYVRVSSDRQEREGKSLSMQRDAIVREAVLSGLELVGIFEDGGISGGKDETKRPGLASALAEIKSGAASVLVVKHADRLSRDGDLAGYLRVVVRRAGGTLLVVDEAKGDPIRRAADTMIAEIERVRGCQRMVSWHREKRIRGERTGRRPVEIKSPDGAVARETAIRMHESGASLRTIAATLNGDGRRTAAGALFQAVTVARMLARAA